MHVARAASGDRASVEWLVARLSPLLRSHAAYRLGSVLRRHYDPDDLVHDAWLAVLPRLDAIGTDEARRRTPALLRYLCNTIVYRIGKLARRHARNGGTGVAAPDAAPPVDLPAEITGAVTRAVRDERHDQLHTSLAELDDGDREIVLLRGVEQLSAKATAAMLGIGVEAAHKRYQRALARLRQRLPDSVFAELDDSSTESAG
jgi:RNA polymerase sigma-70 factor (ECF subfamily)